jgi:hypothetical protein
MRYIIIELEDQQDRYIGEMTENISKLLRDNGFKVNFTGNYPNAEIMIESAQNKLEFLRK